MKRLLVALLVLASSSAFAQTTAYRVGPGVQMTTSASRPTTIAGRRTIWPDSSNRLRFWNGTADLQVAAVAAATKGDLAAWTGSAWAVLAAGTDGYCLKTDSGESTGLKWATCGGSGGGTFASIYSSTASDNRTTVTSGGGGIEILDASSPIGASLLTVYNNGRSLAYLNAAAAGVSMTQATMTSGEPAPVLLVTGRPHTGLTASTPYSDVYFDFAQTRQFATGAITSIEPFYIGRPTYSFVGSSTITNASTLHIENCPGAGTNATITNCYSLWAEAGQAYLQGGLKLAGSVTGTYNIGGTPTATSPIRANLGATTIAPTWTAITYSNSWVDFGASSTSRYTKGPDGLVTLEIRAKNGSSATAALNSGTPIAAGYRPGQLTQICGQTLAGAIACGDLDTGGVFTPSVGSTAGIFLRATYFAEN